MQQYETSPNDTQPQHVSSKIFPPASMHACFNTSIDNSICHSYVSRVLDHEDEVLYPSKSCSFMIICASGFMS